MRTLTCLLLFSYKVETIAWPNIKYIVKDNVVKMMKYIIRTISILLIAIGCTPGENGVPEQADTKDPYAYEGFVQMDSLFIGDIELPEILNMENFDSTTIKMFQTVANGTGGQLYFAANASRVVEKVVEIINNHGADNADLCFLVDKTGSMSDDIEMMNQSMDTILNAIKKFSNMNVAIAFYGDKNVDGRTWYESYDFTTDYDKIRTIWKKYRVSGGGDAPESVTDGAHNVVANLSWTSTTKRIMLVLGDAPSLEPPLASYSVADIVKQANKNGIVSNYYPVVVGFAWDETGPKQSELIAGLYPNPASAYTNLILKNRGEYLVELFSQDGTLIESSTVTTLKHQLKLDKLSAGIYLVRVTTPNGSQVDVTRFIKQ